MSVRKQEDEPSTSQMKIRKVDEEGQQPNGIDGQATNQLAIVAVPNEQNESPRPQIFKLDVDCVQEVFDYLSIKDIHSVSETCTRMQRIAGDYLQTYAVNKMCYHYRDGNFTNDGLQMNGLKEFAQELMISARLNDEGYRTISLHCKSLKKISFRDDTQLNATKIEHLKPILSKIESVNFSDTDIEEGDFHEMFLKFCPNLKNLYITSRKPNGIIGTNNDWFLRNYPSLECLKIFIPSILEIPELRTFFELNSNLRKLSIVDDAFMLNINAMLETNLKLDVLSLVIYDDVETVCHRLNQLYDKGFYQRLHLIVEEINQQKIDMISSLRGLEYLHLFPFTSSDLTPLNLNSLSSLKLLSWINFYKNEVRTPYMIDLQSTAKHLINLEQLYISGCVTSEKIEPFVRHSTKLKAIKIGYLVKEEGIDLSALNKEREQLVGARKVTIYLEEQDYLATKWSRNITDIKFIEVRRAASSEMPFLLY